MSETISGFILTAKTIDIKQKAYIQLFCKNHAGPFLINIDDQKPVFFILRSSSTPETPIHLERKEVGLKSFSKESIDALYFNSMADFYKVKDLCKLKKIRTFESDIRNHDRFLMERFINGSIEIQLTQECKIPENDFPIYHNPKVKKSNFLPSFNICSLDIETSMTDDLYSIAFHQYNSESNTSELKKVIMIGPTEKSKLDYLEYYPNEKDLLVAYIKILNTWDPDLILGWHIVGFDFNFLIKKCYKYNIPMKIGRYHGDLKITERKGAGWFSDIDGRVILDGPPILRGAFYQFSNFKLDTVAAKVLGTHKDISSTGLEKVNEITRRFMHDKEALAKYNLLDCTLVIDIFKKLGLVKMLLTRVNISGMLLNRIGVSTSAFDHYYLPKYHRKGYVASNIHDTQINSHAAGGYVLEPKMGLHEHVIVLDFKSLYPSIIRTFKIDPLSNLENDRDPVYTPSGHHFSRSQHILPEFITELLDLRSAAKFNKDENLSQAIKILMNSFYGVMGSGGSRFYHANLPSAITETGQWILKECISFLKKEGFEVIYGDTDSVFIKLKDLDKTAPFQKARILEEKLNLYFNKLISSQFYTESYLEIEFEKYYTRFFLPISRDGNSAAKKRYAGLIHEENGNEKIEFKGLEAVRSDWTTMAREFQTELFENLFFDKDIFSIIKSKVEDLKNGLFDDKLSYQKRLTKPAGDYIKIIPPHVKAAMILDPTGEKKLKSINYLITHNGPEPSELLKSKIDYNHYIEKQIKPIANGVLFLFEKNFDDIVIGDQLNLF